MKLSTSGLGQQQAREGENKCLNSELVSYGMPALAHGFVYPPRGLALSTFPRVAATTNKEVDTHIPNYPNLPPQLICQLHNVTMHADVETDEVYDQISLQPLTPEEQEDTFLPMELGIPSKQPTNYFYKTLAASDTSTHGGFYIPRRAAEKVFPPLDFSQQPPAQELIARDLHDVQWKFRHIFRGQPKRHLLTTGWSVFVSAKRLVARDSVIFIWYSYSLFPTHVAEYVFRLLLGIHRAARSQTVMSSSVLSSDSMHIGLLAAAAHAAATNSCFTVFYNPRASPSDFVITFSKYVKAVFHTRVSRPPFEGLTFILVFTAYLNLDSLVMMHGNIRGGGPREQELQSPNLPSFVSYPWMQQKLDSSFPGNDYNLECQPMLSNGLQNLVNGDLMRQQLQQSYVQQPGSYNSLLQAQQSQILTENLPPVLGQEEVSNQPEEQAQKQHNMIQNDQLKQRQQVNAPSSANLLNFSTTGQSMLADQLPQQSWAPKYTHSQVNAFSSSTSVPKVSPGKDAITELYICNKDAQNPTHFGVNNNSYGLLLRISMPGFTTSSSEADVPSIPLEDPSFQTPLYGCMQDSSELQSAGVVDPPTPTRTFVKVYKSGSVGRSLDISRFSSYHELREELAQIFGIERKLEDPLRSGWQLVFVNRENDILLLGDDPWEDKKGLTREDSRGKTDLSTVMDVVYALKMQSQKFGYALKMQSQKFGSFANRHNADRCGGWSHGILQIQLSVLGMEAPVTENSSTGNDHDQEQVFNRGVDSNPEINREEEQEHEQEQDEEQVRRILQVISTTGNFWHSWDKLKSMLSSKLKLVLSEYPEAKMTVDEQNASLGETYLELVTRLDEGATLPTQFVSFTMFDSNFGPCLKNLAPHPAKPIGYVMLADTISSTSRILTHAIHFNHEICHILLAARSIYSKLSKLALALEKNLLVTSTLTVCTKPYPEMKPVPGPEKASEEAQPQCNSIQNGIEPTAGDRDEIMSEVEADIEEITVDMDAFQEMAGPQEVNSTEAENS
ncbi:Auxin response factor 12 [Hibiscus syriacus]|uniref:Auxin response factor 12 n=1 Tax=Hibiscus syriacus TaxID=106335 RepID=A0A6A3AKS6_HIBSY|nr:Auxin response factor 12 [Hibiscus syriacus]